MLSYSRHNLSPLGLGDSWGWIWGCASAHAARSTPVPWAPGGFAQCWGDGGEGAWDWGLRDSRVSAPGCRPLGKLSVLTWAPHLQNGVVNIHLKGFREGKYHDEFFHEGRGEKCVRCRRTGQAPGSVCLQPPPCSTLCRQKDGPEIYMGHTQPLKSDHLSVG